MELQSKIIPSFDGKYEIRTDGTVFSHYSSKVLAMTDNGNGYFNVKLQLPIVNGIKVYQTRYVHRLVAEAFLPNPDDLRQVNHIDGNKANNALTNLEWVSPLQNTHHAILTGLTTLRVGFIPAHEYPLVLQELLTYTTSTAELAARYGYAQTNSFNTAIKHYATGTNQLQELLPVLKHWASTSRSKAVRVYGKPVYGVHKDTGEVTKVFETKSDAAAFSGASVANITTAISRKSYAKSYFWFEASNGRPSQQCDDNKVS